MSTRHMKPLYRKPVWPHLYKDKPAGVRPPRTYRAARRLMCKIQHGIWGPMWLFN